MRLAKHDGSGQEFNGYSIGYQPRPYWLHWGLDRDRNDSTEYVVASSAKSKAKGFDNRDTVGNMFGPEPKDHAARVSPARASDPAAAAARAASALAASAPWATAPAWRGSRQRRARRVAFTRAASLGEHTPHAPSLATRVTPEAAQRVLGHASSRLRACLSAPSSVELTVTPDGRAADVTVTDASAPEASCVRRVAASLHFPAASSAVRVSHRLR